MDEWPQAHTVHCTAGLYTGIKLMSSPGGRSAVLGLHVEESCVVIEILIRQGGHGSLSGPGVHHQVLPAPRLLVIRGQPTNHLHHQPWINE